MGLAKDVEADGCYCCDDNILFFLFFDLPVNETLTVHWLLFSLQHPFGEVGIYPQRHASRLDSLSNYRRLTSAPEFSSCSPRYLPIIPRSAHGIPNHSMPNKPLNDTLL